MCVACLQVDGLENPKVQSVFFPDTPLHKAAFANDGAQVCHTDLLTTPFCALPTWHCLSALHTILREFLNSPVNKLLRTMAGCCVASFLASYWRTPACEPSCLEHAVVNRALHLHVSVPMRALTQSALSKLWHSSVILKAMHNTKRS